MGKIEITVCAARKLHDNQLIGIPDPFVRITCGDKHYKTKVTKDTLNPEWNETFRFMIADENSTQIRIEVWNKNTYNDDLMGLYTLSVGGLSRGIVKDDWYILDRSKTQAELRLRVLAVDFGVPPRVDEQWMVTTDVTKDPVQRAIEDGTWRPGQKTIPPRSGPPQQAPYVVGGGAYPVQPQQQPPYVQQQPQYVQQAPQVQYVVQQPQYAQPMPQYAQAPPQQYYQQPPPPQQPPYGYAQPQPQPGYYPPAPPQPAPCYIPPQQMYAPQPAYRY